MVRGNNEMASGSTEKAIGTYEDGLANFKTNSNDTLLTFVTLETNLATAYSQVGNMDKTFEHYESAMAAYDESSEKEENKKDAEQLNSIISQTAFFYAMELQEIDAKKSIPMYARAIRFDPNQWSAWANLGASLVDSM